MLEQGRETEEEFLVQRICSFLAWDVQTVGITSFSSEIPQWLEWNALLSSRDNPDTLCMIFDVSVWFLEISQLPAACFSSSRYLQEQHICLNHAAQKHLSLFLHSCCLSLFSSSCSPRHCATCLELHWCSPINWPCADGMKELHGENREQL